MARLIDAHEIGLPRMLNDNAYSVYMWLSMSLGYANATDPPWGVCMQVITLANA